MRQVRGEGQQELATAPDQQKQGRNLSQFSHGLTGRRRTMASILDTWQDPDLRIRTPAH